MRGRGGGGYSFPKSPSQGGVGFAPFTNSSWESTNSGLYLPGCACAVRQPATLWGRPCGCVALVFCTLHCRDLTALLLVHYPPHSSRPAPSTGRGHRYGHPPRHCSGLRSPRCDCCWHSRVRLQRRGRAAHGPDCLRLRRGAARGGRCWGSRARGGDSTTEGGLGWGWRRGRAVSVRGVTAVTSTADLQWLRHRAGRDLGLGLGVVPVRRRERPVLCGPGVGGRMRRRHRGAHPRASGRPGAAGSGGGPGGAGGQRGRADVLVRHRPGGRGHRRPVFGNVDAVGPRHIGAAAPVTRDRGRDPLPWAAAWQVPPSALPRAAALTVREGDAVGVRATGARRAVIGGTEGL